MARLSPLAYLRRLRDDRRALGWKGLFRKHGWKPLVLFVVFYLVRDVVLYILIPLAVLAGIWN